MPKNLEFKASVDDVAGLEKAFTGIGAQFTAVLNQRDIYFNVRSGRLKQREVEGKSAELIYYERDEASSSEMLSRYSVVPIHDASVKDMLSKALGVKVVVEKTRRLLMLKNARIHLDAVKNLGTFLEFEVVSSGRTPSEQGDDKADAELLEKLKRIAASFVDKEINASYSDLVILAGCESNS